MQLKLAPPHNPFPRFPAPTWTSSCQGLVAMCIFPRSFAMKLRLRFLRSCLEEKEKKQKASAILLPLEALGLFCPFLGTPRVGSTTKEAVADSYYYQRGANDFMYDCIIIISIIIARSGVAAI